MDIVAEASPVRSRVVVAVDGQCGPLALNCLEDDWNEMGLGIVHFANRTTVVSARGIEVPEAHILETIGCAVGFERIFKCELCRAVGIYRLLRARFGDW